VFQCISFGGFADAELPLVLLCGTKLSDFQAFQCHPSSLWFGGGSEVLAKLCLIFVFLATLCLIFWATIAYAVQKTKSLQWPHSASCGQIMVEIAEEVLNKA
jgi:hypothetical protein